MIHTPPNKHTGTHTRPDQIGSPFVHVQRVEYGAYDAPGLTGEFTLQDVVASDDCFWLSLCPLVVLW